MFRSWFPRGIFSWKSTQNRIDSLYTNAEDVPHNKVFSPTLQDLQNQKNKVKEMSSNYEELHLGGDTPNCSFQASIHNTKCRKASLVEGPDEEGDQMNVTFSQLTMEAPVGEDGKASLKDIIVSEEKYIKLQELMIAKYVREFETESGFILSNETSIIKRQKEELFGPIEAIYRFHKEEFQPMLVSCGDDVMLFATSLSKMCKDGAFNIYLIYAMDEKVSDRHIIIYVLISTQLLRFSSASIVEISTSSRSLTKS